jgi:hypothetical protein
MMQVLKAFYLLNSHDQAGYHDQSGSYGAAFLLNMMSKSFSFIYYTADMRPCGKEFMNYGKTDNGEEGTGAGHPCADQSHLC